MNVRHHMGFWFSSYALKYYWPIKLWHSLKCNIFRKKWLMKFIADQHSSFLRVDAIILGVRSQAYPKYPK